jgi:predicted CXXCH cytochrome family protein
MHRMTRDMAHAEVGAPFDGRGLKLGKDEARFEERSGQRFMSLSRDGALSLFRVTKVIGGRYREDFVGAEVRPSDPFGEPIDAQRVLPLSFLRFDGTLRYKGYSVMVRERRSLEPGLVWQSACILCHNTAPQFVALYDELYGAGAPSYQGSASNELPADTAFKYVIDDPDGLRSALQAELGVLGAAGSLPANPQHALAVAISNTRERWSEAALVELGVGCESCHGGSRQHAEAPERFKTSFGVQSSFMHVQTAAGGPLTRAQEINRGCAKCHTVLFSQYGFTWEGGARRDRPGGSTTNSGEARDFLLGACSSAMNCATCHDPHGTDSKAKLDAMGQVGGNVVCTKCHESLAAPGGLAAHTHHRASSEGSACLSCHMPKKNMGLAYELTRYHRIGSPTDEARVLGDRPLECALCHADRSVDQIVTTMERWWGKRYDRAKLRALYGADLRKNPLRIALMAGKPHEQVVAADVAARHAMLDATSGIVALLGSDYPLVRFFARHSLERQLGTKLELDMSLTGPELVAAAKALVAAGQTEQRP